MFRLPWLTRRRRGGTGVTEEARAARQRASADLARVRERSDRVDRVSGYLRRENARNHWSERMRAAWRGVPDA